MPRPSGRGWAAGACDDPAAAAWRHWTRVRLKTHREVPNMGRLATWHELLTVAPGRVSFRTVVVRDADGTPLTAESTLRVRSREELERSIAQVGFTVEDVRDAPDRPGQEWVFIARRLLQWAASTGESDGARRPAV